MESDEFQNRVDEINRHICEKCKRSKKCVDKTQNCNVKIIMWFLGNKIANRKGMLKGNK